LKEPESREKVEAGGDKREDLKGSGISSSGFLVKSTENSIRSLSVRIQQNRTVKKSGSTCQRAGIKDPQERYLNRDRTGHGYLPIRQVIRWTTPRGRGLALLGNGTLGGPAVEVKQAGRGGWKQGPSMIWHRESLGKRVFALTTKCDLEDCSTAPSLSASSGGAYGLH